MALAAGETWVRVAIGQANLRVVNADDVEIAGQASLGQPLQVVGPASGPWLPVVPPDDVSFWIYAELVRDGRPLADKVQVRAGPGLNYRVVGSVNRDTALVVRGRLGDWVKIKPPPGFPVWISSRAVTPLADGALAVTIAALPPATVQGLIAALHDPAVASTGGIMSATAATNPPPVPPVVTPPLEHAP